MIALLGLGNVLLPLTCVRGCSPTEGVFYAVGFLGGLGLLAVAHGIRRRLPWAWWLGFCMIGFGGTYFVAQGLYAGGPTRDPFMNVLIFLIAAGAVGIGLTTWWFRQRAWFAPSTTQASDVHT